jgi:hypothetical protein
VPLGGTGTCALIPALTSSSVIKVLIILSSILLFWAE